MTHEPPAAALYRLMAWLSPAYPVGAFSYSSGLEWAVEAGDVVSAETLRHWLAVVLEHGGGFCDAVFLVQLIMRWRTKMTPRCMTSPSWPPPSRLRASVTWRRPRRVAPSSMRRALPGHAPRSTASLRCGTVRSPIRSRSALQPQGMKFRWSRLSRPICRPLRRIWSRPACASFRSARPTASAWLPVSKRVVSRTAERALAMPLDAVGSAAFRADLASMRHETQYTRLFRS